MIVKHSFCSKSQKLTEASVVKRQLPSPDERPGLGGRRRFRLLHRSPLRPLLFRKGCDDVQPGKDVGELVPVNAHILKSPEHLKKTVHVGFLDQESSQEKRRWRKLDQPTFFSQLCITESGYKMASLYPRPQVRSFLPWVSGNHQIELFCYSLLQMSSIPLSQLD